MSAPTTLDDQLDAVIVDLVRAGDRFRDALVTARGELARIRREKREHSDSLTPVRSPSASNMRAISAAVAAELERGRE